MSVITSLLQRLLEGKNLSQVSRDSEIPYDTIWRIATGRQHADMRTGDAEKLHLHLTGEPLVEKEVGE
jgi:hypothetical protein